MDASRLSMKLHKHFAGLIAYSELSESELSLLARQLSNLPLEEDAVRRALIASDVCRWRLAADDKVWDGQLSSSEFLGQHPEGIVDSWQEDVPMIPEHLILEVVRGA